MNRERSWKKAHPTAYQKGDIVLYWTPKQPKHYRTDDRKREMFIEAPGKWKARWTGPHTIIARTSNNTYDIRHGDTFEIRKDIHTDTLTPFHPWSDAHVSTSEMMDKIPKWKVGGEIDKGTMVALPDSLNRFSIGKLLEDAKKDDSELYFQWFSNWSENSSKVGSLFKPGWINQKGKRYYGDRTKGDKPYTNRETDTSICRHSVMMHSFDILESGKLSKSVRKAIEQFRKDFHINPG